MFPRAGSGCRWDLFLSLWALALVAIFQDATVDHNAGIVPFQAPRHAVQSSGSLLPCIIGWGGEMALEGLGRPLSVPGERKNFFFHSFFTYWVNVDPGKLGFHWPD